MISKHVLLVVFHVGVYDDLPRLLLEVLVGLVRRGITLWD
jgi:hypothetical protein